MRRTAENKLKVVAVRIDPFIEQRLRVLAEATGRKQSFFLQQMIEGGLDAIEESWLSSDTLAKVRSGALPDRLDEHRTTSDLFDHGASDPAPSSVGLFSGSARLRSFLTARKKICEVAARNAVQLVVFGTFGRGEGQPEPDETSTAFRVKPCNRRGRRRIPSWPSAWKYRKRRSAAS